MTVWLLTTIAWPLGPEAREMVCPFCVAAAPPTESVVEPPTMMLPVPTGWKLTVLLPTVTAALEPTAAEMGVRTAPPETEIGEPEAAGVTVVVWPFATIRTPEPEGRAE